MEELIKEALSQLEFKLMEDAECKDYDSGICMATVTATDGETEVYIDATAYFTAPRLIRREDYWNPAEWSEMSISQPVITDAVAIVGDQEINIKHLITL
jgi:hypothetical protein